MAVIVKRRQMAQMAHGRQIYHRFFRSVSMELLVGPKKVADLLKCRKKIVAIVERLIKAKRHYDPTMSSGSQIGSMRDKLCQRRSGLVNA
jgi:hypothetical protein